MTYVGSQIGQFMQHKRAEEVQRRFRAAIDVSADLVLLVDPLSARYIDANETACLALGYGREELLTMGPQDTFSASSEDLLRLDARLIADNPSAAPAQGWYRRKDGSRFAVESTSRAVPSAGGHVIVAVARDITERRRQQQLVDLEHTVTRRLSEADSVSVALKSVMRTICEAQGWDCSRYFHADEKAGLLRFADASGLSSDLVDRLIEKSRGTSYTQGSD